MKTEEMTRTAQDPELKPFPASPLPPIRTRVTTRRGKRRRRSSFWGLFYATVGMALTLLVLGYSLFALYGYLVAR